MVPGIERKVMKRLRVLRIVFGRVNDAKESRSCDLLLSGFRVPLIDCIYQCFGPHPWNGEFPDRDSHGLNLTQFLFLHLSVPPRFRVIR